MSSLEADPSDGHLRRAELLADLGRFDEAEAELAHHLDNGAALALLAAIRLAAGRTEGALAAAERAVAATPGALPPQVVQGEALCELRRFREAATVAEKILDAGPDDPYAQLHGAAILGDSRNGQRALDAAWQAVTLAPQDARAHLVLAGVAARLQLKELAERAREEALRLDPTLTSATGHLRRYVVPDTRALELRPTPATAIGWLALYVGTFVVPVAVLAAVLHPAHPATSRAAALLLGAGGLGLVALFALRLPGSAREILFGDRASTLAACATIAGPVAILVYGAVGNPWALAAALATTALAGVAAVSRVRF